MGRIKNFFNKIFGRQPKALNEAKENYAIPRDLPEDERKSSLQETLESQTIKPDELNLDGVVDMMVEAYGLENICKNARGREMLTDMVKNKIDLDAFSKNGAYSVEYAKGTLERAFGKFEKQGKITLKEENMYVNNYTKEHNDGTYVGGKCFTTLEADENGKLVETCEGCWEHEKNSEDTPISYYKNSRTFDESGIEVEKVLMNETKEHMNTFRGVPNKQSFGDPEMIIHGSSTIVKRVDGLYAEVASRKNGQTVRGESFVNTEYGIDDLYTTGMDEKIDRPDLDNMSNSEREQYDKSVKDVIGKSKYKEGLTKMIPGAKDLGKDEVAKDIE